MNVTIQQRISLSLELFKYFMTTLRKTYEKDKQIVYTHNKFIYCSSVYQMWGWGAALMEEKYYASNRPITLKKKNLISVKRKNYSLYRFFELQFAPEEWLLQQGYKLIDSNIN